MSIVLLQITTVLLQVPGEVAPFLGSLCANPVLGQIAAAIGLCG
jgi:hypothetical protein